MGGIGAGSRGFPADGLEVESVWADFCGGGLFNQAGTSVVASCCAVAHVATQRCDAAGLAVVAARDAVVMRLARHRSVRVAATAAGAGERRSFLLS